MKRALAFLFILSLCFAGSWFPTSFSIENVLLNSTHPLNGQTYYCSVDAFTINSSGVTSATFVIQGAGVDINSSETESIGTQSSTYLTRWVSTNFTTNGTGLLNCTATLIDNYGTSKTASGQWYVATQLGSCTTADCVINSATEVYPGIYRYNTISINRSGMLYQVLNSSEMATYGGAYNFSVDTGFYLNGTISLNGTSYQTNLVGMPAGTLYIYTNGEVVFNTSSTVTGTGGAGYSNSTQCGNGNPGGMGLNITIEADIWHQNGTLTSTGGSAGTPGAKGGDGKKGGSAGTITFYGNEWKSIGAITFVGGAGTSGTSASSDDVCGGNGGDGGGGGDIGGIYVYGFLNKTGGTLTLTQGAPGNGEDGYSGHAGGDGGDGGGFNAFTVQGRVYAEGFGVTTTSPRGGSGGAVGSSVFDGDGGDGGSGVINFMQFDGTDFYWNATAISITLGQGGLRGSTDALYGNGGSWTITGNSTYNGIKCRDTCRILSGITLTGGLAGGTGASAGTDAGWEVQYNLVGVGNDFTLLDVSRTTYNLSADSTFIMNKSLGDTLTLTRTATSVYALDTVNFTWTTTNTTGQSTLYFDLKEVGPSGAVKYPLWNSTKVATPLRTEANMTFTYSLNTHNYTNGTYTYYIRERASTYYRFSDWTSATLEVSLANVTLANSSVTNATSAGYRTFSCGVSGYDFYSNGTQWLQNTSKNMTLYFGTVSIIVQTNDTTNTTYATTYSSTTGLYSASILSTQFALGTRPWWCSFSKIDYQAGSLAGTNLTVPNFEVLFPTGITTVKLVCYFPTVSGVVPVGQSATKPIMTILNHNETGTKNYTLTPSMNPTNASIYFNNVTGRTGQVLLNASKNITACAEVPFGNTTACRVWLYADCVNAPTGTSGLNFTWGETK